VPAARQYSPAPGMALSAKVRTLLDYGGSGPDGKNGNRKRGGSGNAARHERYP
jgi:hypothetical protein